jgi:TonB-dependent SusC/RagA subfamily outer membrane receptor
LNLDQVAPEPLNKLRVLLLLGLLAGCARAGNTGRPEAEDAPETSPPQRTAVTAEDIERAPGQPIEQLLTSRFAGVVVTRTAGGISIRIRGASSIHGSDQPLYVIDGVAVEPGSDGTLWINPHDIESIEVPKDAASMTMYGARGANGVIVIKMKRD